MKTNTRLSILLATLTLTLVACGQGTGTGARAGTGQSVAASESVAINQMRSLQVSKGTAANISFPASSVVISALTTEAIEAGQDPKRLHDALAVLYILDMSKVPDIAAEDVDKIIDDTLKLITDEPDTSLTPERRHLFELLKKGDRQPLHDAIARDQARNAIVAITQPNAGWILRLINPTPTVRKQTDRYIRYVQTNVEFANIIITELAGTLATAAWKDPAAARQAVLLAWHDMPIEKIRAALAAAQAEASDGRVTIDMVTGRDMHWTGASGDFLGDGAGWTVTKNGALWYGGGALSGRKVDIALASAISSSASKAAGASFGSDSKVGVDARGNAQVQ